MRLELPVAQQYPDCTLFDIGCGWGARLLNTVEPFIWVGASRNTFDFETPGERYIKLFHRSVESAVVCGA
jgi:hypothetical protein